MRDEEQRIIAAARKAFGALRYQVDFSYGQWWVTCFEDRRMWLAKFLDNGDITLKIVRREDEFI